MGIRTTESDPRVALYDSVSGFAFGPTFDTGEEAERFLRWYRNSYLDDLRTLTHKELAMYFIEWSEKSVVSNE
jgi:hypothetical protein